MVTFLEANLLALHFLFHERVAVEPVGGVERKEAGHAHDDGPQNLVPDVEVVVGKTALLMRQDAIVGILGGELRDTDAEGASLLHALEYGVDAIDVPLSPCGVARAERNPLCGRPFRPIPSQFRGCGHTLPPSSGNRWCAG